MNGKINFDHVQYENVPYIVQVKYIYKSKVKMKKYFVCEIDIL